MNHGGDDVGVFLVCRTGHTDQVALDTMSRRPYGVSKLKFPASHLATVRTVCLSTRNLYDGTKSA